MRLPNGEDAIIPVEKLRDYCLNPDHPYGKDKAYLFDKLFHITGENLGELYAMLEFSSRNSEVVLLRDTPHGTIYYLDTPVVRNGRPFMLRSQWIIRLGENFPRFVTCYIMGKGANRNGHH